jgi:nicotinamidase-related amidase
MADDSKAAKQAEFLRTVLEPSHTALLTMELQNGVVGPDALMPVLGDAVARAGILPRIGQLCAAAREVGVRVVHCTALSRPDGAGAKENCIIFAAEGKRRRATGSAPTTVGTRGAELVDELGRDPRDIEVPRFHGMSPFMSTALDQTIRNLGVTSVVVVGVSVNLGIFGTVMSALDLGYQVVLPRDCVAGVPDEYAQAVIDNSLSLLSTVVTSADVYAAWGLTPPRG